MKRINKRKYQYVLLCSLLASAITLKADAAELLRLAEVDGKTFRSGIDPIVIEFGEEMIEEMVQYLHLEIDAIDVTDFVKRDARALVYSMQEPLEPGRHEIRVVAILPDGVIEEAAVWSVEVRDSRAYQVARARSNLSAQLLYRADDSLVNPPASRYTGQGTVQLSTRHENEGETITSHANLVYNSREEQNLGGKEFELTDYQLKTALKNGSFVLGHQTLPVNNLVMSDFNRRGVSAGLQNDNGSLSVIGFGTRTEEIVGIAHPIGIEQKAHRTTGVGVSMRPFQDNPEYLSLSALYLEGRGQTEGIAQIGDETIDAGGDAQAVTLESYLGNRHWRLRGEAAQTTYDFDGLSSGYAAKTDDAYTVLVGYSPSRALGYASDDIWSIDLMHQKVGPWFRSSANPALTTDRETTQLSASYQANAVGLSVVMARGEDNVDAVRILPVTGTDTLNLNISYTPQPAYGATESHELGRGLFANPSFSLGLNQTALQLLERPAGYTGDEVDNRYLEVSASASFSGSFHYWMLSHSRLYQKDEVYAMNESRGAISSLDAQFMLGPYLRLSPALQRSVTDYYNNGYESVSDVASLGFGLNYPHNWSSSLVLNRSHDYASDDSIDVVTRTAELSVLWNAIQVADNRTGVSFTASASYQDIDNAGVKTDAYQVFVGVSLAMANNY